MVDKECVDNAGVNAGVEAHVHDPARLAALKAVALLDTPTEESFDRLTWLATRAVKAPVSLVSLVDAERQFFKSSLGLPEPWLSRRQTPLSHSFCQHNRVPMQPLLIPDAREHPVFKDNPAIQDLKVVAYLGIPLVTCDGYVLGSFCVIDSKPRDWTSEEIMVVRNLAASVMTEINLRAEIRSREEAEEALKRQHEELQKAHRELETETAERLKTVEQLLQREQMLIQQSRQAAMGEMINNIAHQWRQPLNKLALLSQELPMSYQRGEFNDRYLAEVTSRMMQTIRQLSTTIEEFRTFFAPGDESSDFGVVDAVARALSLLEDRLKQSEITAEVSSTCAPVVHGYGKQYSQAVLAILANAIDALDKQKERPPKITIEIGCEGERSIVTITDNAGGVPENMLAKIFEPYFTTKGPRTTGIGLYMAKIIIEKNMDGRLEVSNFDGGARFRITV